MSKDPAIGKRTNPTPDTGLSTDHEGALFDVTQWRKEHAPKKIDDLNELMNKMLLELRRLNLHMSIITEEELNETDIEDK